MKLNMTTLLVFLLYFLNGCLVVIHADIPIITEPTVPKIHYQYANDTVKLSCQASLKHGFVEYSWLRNGTSMIPKSSTPTGQQISYNWRDGSLIITKFNEDYNGDYNCVASSEDVSSMSQTQTLIQVKYPSFHHQQPIKYQKDEYTYLKIPFDNHSEIVSDNSMVYYWFTKKGMNQIGMNDDRRFIDKKGNLHFTFLKKDEDGYAATEGYTCGFVTDKMILGLNSELRITTKGEKDIQPALEYRSVRDTGLLGSEAQLECFFSGYDTKTTDHLPTIKWFDNKIQIKNSNKFKLSRNNRILTIKNLEEKDEKYYFCQGFTTNGHTEKQNVFLNVTSKPIWVAAPQSITKQTGHTAVINCQARSSIGEIAPTPPVWYINAKKIQNYDDYPEYNFSADKTKLTVKVEGRNDTNCFQCIVTNSIGKLMGEACLKAVYPIDVSVQPPYEQYIQKGEIIDLTVHAIGGIQSNISLTCEWDFHNAKVTTPLRYYVETNDTLGTTFIDTSKLCQRDYDKIGGVYTCPLTYGNHSKVITTEIALKEYAPASASDSSGNYVPYVGGIFLFFVGVVLTIAIVSLKQQEGKKNVDKTKAGGDPANESQGQGVNEGDDEDSD